MTLSRILQVFLAVSFPLYHVCAERIESGESQTTLGLRGKQRTEFAARFRRVEPPERIVAKQWKFRVRSRFSEEKPSYYQG